MIPPMVRCLRPGMSTAAAATTCSSVPIEPIGGGTDSCEAHLIRAADLAAADAADGTPDGVIELANIASPICFAAGTMILTAQGEVAIEDLRAGDLVHTKDGGLQEIR